MATTGIGMFFFEDECPNDLANSTFSEIHDHNIYYCELPLPTATPLVILTDHLLQASVKH
jgi:hypothetical protein